MKSIRLALLPILLLPACSRDRDPGPTRFPGANVVLLTLDTVRYDRLGSSGYARPTTPNLDALAKESVRFSMAFSQSSFTPPSHASILTGRYPSSHGVTWWDTALPTEVVTLGEVVKESRYHTAMFSGLKMGAGNGLAHGFDRAVENDAFGFKLPIGRGLPDYAIPPGDLLNEKALAWIGLGRETPYFAWIHYYDAHRPFAIFTKDRPFCADPTARLGDDTNGDYQLDPAERAKRGIGMEQAQTLIDRYDSGLLDLDKKVGALLAELRRRGDLENTILVVTADHGEAFTEYEEEWFTHDPFLFDAVTHVPLLIRFPKGWSGGKTVDQLAQSIDIMPTVLDYLGIVPPALQGTSLRAAIEHDLPVNDYVACERRGRSREKDADGKVVELSAAQVGARRSLRWKGERLVVEQHGEQMRLYAGPPGSAESLVGDSEGAAAAGREEVYRSLVKRIEALSPTLDVRNLSPEQLEFLKQNGYN